VSPKLVACTNAFARERLRFAETFFEAADELLQLDDTPYRRNVIITNYVHAGIGASDAICCFELKAHSKGDDHGEAIAQLKKVSEDGAALAKALSDLLSLKTRAGWGERPLTASDMKRAGRAVEKLIDAARSRRA
jgi:hypothetical protein